MPSSKEECFKLLKKRIEANDPAAMYQEGVNQRKKGNYRSAIEYYSKAAELGVADAHYTLSIFYYGGLGTEKDEGKYIYHLEEAAISGQPDARRMLGCHEWNDGNIDRAVKHWIIAATQGEDRSIKELIDAFKDGLISKDDLASTLRAHQAAVDAMKS